MPRITRTSPRAVDAGFDGDTTLYAPGPSRVGVGADFYDYIIARARLDLTAAPSPAPSPPVGPAAGATAPGSGGWSAGPSALEMLVTFESLSSAVAGAHKMITLIDTLLEPDEAGVPAKGMSIWDFLARVDLDGSPIQWRTDLGALLADADHPMKRKMVRDRAMLRIAAARKIMLSPRYDRAARYYGDYGAFQTGRARGLKLLEGARLAVDRWFADKSARATLHFGVRPPGGGEYVAHPQDDLTATVMWTRAEREKAHKSWKTGPVASYVAVPGSAAAANPSLIKRTRVKARGLHEMQRVAKTLMPQVHELLAKGHSAAIHKSLKRFLGTAKLRPIAAPPGYGARALLIEGAREHAAIGYDIIISFDGRGALFGLAHTGSPSLQFWDAKPSAKEARIDNVKQWGGATWLLQAFEAARPGDVATALREDVAAELGPLFAHATYASAAMPDGAAASHAVNVTFDRSSDVFGKRVTVLTDAEGVPVDYRATIDGTVYSRAMVEAPQAIGVVTSTASAIPRGTYTMTGESIRSSHGIGAPPSSTTEAHTAKLTVRGLSGDRMIVRFRGRDYALETTEHIDPEVRAWSHRGPVEASFDRGYGGDSNLLVTLSDTEVGVSSWDYATLPSGGDRKVFNGTSPRKTVRDGPKQHRLQLMEFTVYDEGLEARRPRRQGYARHRGAQTLGVTAGLDIVAENKWIATVNGTQVELRPIEIDGRAIMRGTANMKIRRFGKREVIVDIDREATRGKRNLRMTWYTKPPAEGDFEWRVTYVEKDLPLGVAAPPPGLDGYRWGEQALARVMVATGIADKSELLLRAAEMDNGDMYLNTKELERAAAAIARR